MNKIIHAATKASAIAPDSAARTAKRISPVSKTLQISRWLSLDVVLGAILSCAMVCRLMAVTPIPWVQLLILGGVVWLIYTLDHLWDVHRMSKVPVTARHFFHWRFEQALWWFAALLFCVLCVAAVVALPAEVFSFGLVLACTVALYLWLVHYLSRYKASRWFLKEIYVAIVYTIGIWGSIWVQAGGVKPVHWLLAFLFGMIALLNLLLFSCYELEEDRMQAQRSVATEWGEKKVNAACMGLFILFMVTVVLLSYSSLQETERKVLSIECLMAAVLLVLFVFPGFFKKEHRYRWIGDGIFLLPVFTLF